MLRSPSLAYLNSLRALAPPAPQPSCVLRTETGPDQGVVYDRQHYGQVSSGYPRSAPVSSYYAHSPSWQSLPRTLGCEGDIEMPGNPALSFPSYVETTYGPSPGEHSDSVPAFLRLTTSDYATAQSSSGVPRPFNHAPMTIRTGDATHGEFSERR